MAKLGVFSLWNGQRPQNSPPRFSSLMMPATTSRSDTCCFNSSAVGPFSFGIVQFFCGLVDIGARYVRVVKFDVAVGEGASLLFMLLRRHLVLAGLLQQL